MAPVTDMVATEATAAMVVASAADTVDGPAATTLDLTTAAATTSPLTAATMADTAPTLVAIMVATGKHRSTRLK